MNLVLNKILFFLFIIVASLNSFAQNDTYKKFSYIIWIREYHKKWIDSENSYWLIETDKPLIDFQNDFLEKTILLSGDNNDIQLCCDDSFYKLNKYETAKKTLYNESEYFDNAETLKISFKPFTIKILALEQTSCKCSSKETNKHFGTKPQIKMSILMNYKALKLSKKEKTNFRKKKKQIIKLLNN